MVKLTIQISISLFFGMFFVAKITLSLHVGLLTDSAAGVNKMQIATLAHLPKGLFKYCLLARILQTGLKPSFMDLLNPLPPPHHLPYSLTSLHRLGHSGHPDGVSDAPDGGDLHLHGVELPQAPPRPPRQD